MSNMHGDAGGGVFRRHVMYVHGFDPRGARVYHGFFRDGAKVAGARWSREISVSSRRKSGQHASLFTLEADDRASGRHTTTRYEVLHWDDIVRRLWADKPPTRLVIEAFHVFLVTWRRGILRTHRKPAWAGFLAIVTPPAIISIVALLAIGGTLLAYWSASALAGALGASETTGLLAGLLAACVVLAGSFLLWRAAERAGNIWWLTRCLDYLLGTAQGRTDRSVERSKLFADRLIETWRRGQADEILVVGHSLGALLTVRMVADALRREPGIGHTGPPLVLLTCGQTIPFYDMLDDAQDLRDDLVLLGTSSRLTFFDVTSGSDPGSACRLRMLHGLGVPEGESRVIQREPDFHDILEPETFQHIRARPLEFHFQYLKPSERGSGFDYFELVTRPEPLPASGLQARAA